MCYLSMFLSRKKNSQICNSCKHFKEVAFTLVNDEDYVFFCDMCVVNCVWNQMRLIMKQIKEKVYV